MIKSSRITNRSSRFFWLAVLTAVTAVAIWAFVTSRTSPSAPILTDNTEMSPQQSVYIPVAFERAALTGDGLSLAGTAQASNTVRLYGYGETGSRVLLGELESGPNGRWQTQIDLAAFDLDLFDQPWPSDLYSQGRAISIDLESVDTEDTLIPASDTLFIVQTQAANAQAGLPSGYAMLITRPGGPSTVLRSPFGASVGQDGLSLQAIDYDNAGGVIVNGRALGSGVVSVLANNTLIGETGISKGGTWSMIAGSTLPISAYDLTIIWRGEDGIERVRLNVPFERFAPDKVFVPVYGQSQMEGVLTTPTSWQLRRRLNGGGHQQSVIYAP